MSKLDAIVINIELVPAARAFNVAAFALVYFYPSLFANTVAFAVLGTLQRIVTLVALFDCVRNFNERGAMVPSL